MQKEKQKNILLIIAMLLALLFVLCIFGLKNVDPTDTTWVINGGGDYFQHYLGWSFFRNSPWIPNFLFFQNLNYPEGTSVIVTDSNPLFCVFFKLFNAILPQDFQFNGIWILFSYLLSTYFAFQISWKLTRSKTLTMTASALVIMNPVILQRALIHDTLTAHWLILAGFWLLVNHSKKWNGPGWAILVILSMLIHAYFVPMLFFVLVLQLIWMLLSRQNWKEIVLPIAAFALAFVLSYFLFGYDHILPQSGSYGELSMNLNAFINPDGTSSLLHDRSSFPLQYEGYNYLGLGLLALIIMGLCTCNRKSWKIILIYLIPCLLYLSIAVSNTICFDKNILFSFTLDEKIGNLLSTFRSSGRLAWPFYYLFLFSSIFAISRFLIRCKKPPVGPILIMGVILVVQFVDLSGFFKTCQTRFSEPQNTLTEIHDPFWDEAAGKYLHLYVSDGESKDIDMFALYAAENGMTFNRSANARGIEPIFGKDKVYFEDLKAEDLESASLYIILDKEKYPELIASCQDRLKEIDGYTVIENASR